MNKPILRITALFFAFLFVLVYFSLNYIFAKLRSTNVDSILFDFQKIITKGTAFS